MTRRGWLLGALMAALPGAGALAQGRVRPEEPLPLPPPPPPPPPPLRSNLAPMPDRGLEDARRSIRDRDAPSLRPDLITPRNTPGNTDSSGFVNRQDQLFRDPAPGFRLRVPLLEDPIRR